MQLRVWFRIMETIVQGLTQDTTRCVLETGESAGRYKGAKAWMPGLDFLLWNSLLPLELGAGMSFMLLRHCHRRLVYFVKSNPLPPCQASPGGLLWHGWRGQCILLLTVEKCCRPGRQHSPRLSEGHLETRTGHVCTVPGKP